MNPNVYTRPNKPKRLTVKERGQGIAPVLPDVLPELRVFKEAQCFITPSEIATQIINYLEADNNMPTLEPSAGTGQIVQALLNSGHSSNSITAVEQSTEIWTFFCERMKAQNSMIKGENCCFLEYAKEVKKRVSFPRIVMNPPFSRGRTDQHIKAALTLLNPSDFTDAVLVALVPSNYTHPEAIELEELPAGTFSSTAIRTKIIRIERSL